MSSPVSLPENNSIFLELSPKTAACVVLVLPHVMHIARLFSPLQNVNLGSPGEILFRSQRRHRSITGPRGITVRRYSDARFVVRKFFLLMCHYDNVPTLDLLGIM